jgi:hypothetical protein
MDAVIVYLQQARHHRDQAERARRLAKTINTPDVADSLLSAAAIREQKARELEASAAMLRATTAQTAGLAADLRSLCEEARLAIAQSTAILHRDAARRATIGAYGYADRAPTEPGEPPRSVAQFPRPRRGAAG